jgi:hypothetical protein
MHVDPELIAVSSYGHLDDGYGYDAHARGTLARQWYCDNFFDSVVIFEHAVLAVTLLGCAHTYPALNLKV